MTLPKQPELSLSTQNLHSNLSNFDKTFINEKNSFVLTKSKLKIGLFFGILAKNGYNPSTTFYYLFYSSIAVFLDIWSVNK